MHLELINLYVANPLLEIPTKVAPSAEELKRRKRNLLQVFKGRSTSRVRNQVTTAASPSQSTQATAHAMSNDEPRRPKTNKV